MSISSALRSAVGVALLVNAVPHGVSGVQGRPFPSPFADPPGVGMSAPTVNVGWSVANVVAGTWMLRRGIRSRGEAVAAAAGGIAMALTLSYHFADVLAGGTGLARRGSKGSGSGPPRTLVRATEPIAKALAGRRAIPLWALLHHRGRKSGTAYSTPVAVVPTVDPAIVLIGLPWGAKTNWARNVVAAGSADLTWKGESVTVVEPRITDASEAADLAKPLFAPVVRRMPAAIVLRRARRPGSP